MKFPSRPQLSLSLARGRPSSLQGSPETPDLSISSPPPIPPFHPRTFSIPQLEQVALSACSVGDPRQARPRGEEEEAGRGEERRGNEIASGVVKAGGGGRVHTGVCFSVNPSSQFCAPQLQSSPWRGCGRFSARKARASHLRKHKGGRQATTPSQGRRGRACSAAQT